MTKEQFAKYINNFDFSELFRVQGWDNFNANHKIEVQSAIYDLTGVAQKKNFPILQCVIDHNNIPDLNNRKQLDKKIRELYVEHLLIIINKEKTWQYWQLPLYEDNKLKTLVSFTWNKGQDVENIFQKLRNIVFTLEEEDIITLADVKERVNILSTNSEKVTKKFYAEFTKQHQAFLGFITGIDDALPDNENEKKQWYASLMLNRLMFCYFIQKKGFLDWNPQYLTDKLAECKKLKGKNNFYSFYRSFLLELFHNELGRPEDKRSKKVSPVSFGAIPYLNGGLFDEHELESEYKSISIKDAAFEKIFTFFDEWNWHLDTRVTASGKDINPDVIGYIFEKYINQKEMGAYYTKEDITDYIGKNTIIPFLLDKVKSYHHAPFEKGYGFWQYLQDSGDEYIYDSVKKGAEGLSSIDDVNIPQNIRIGIDTSKPNLLDRRKDWNTATPEGIGLPTEIWRETIARLQRYFELRAKIKKGELQNINDLITYNLNIRKLIQDYLEQTRDTKFIRNFYKALCEITILDPTCGSGAFLFAALNILEPLYEVCLRRIEEFYIENPKWNDDFKERLPWIKQSDHPNLSYYIFKTIILNNLYGVDLMKEAVEIAKLRLFLKLVAEVDPSRRKKNYGLEPLPDIDFNIRSGNTLVGFATEKQLEEVVKNVDGSLIFEERFAELKSACKAVAKSYEHFQAVQVSMSNNNEKYKEIKRALSNELKTLDEKLNRYLADTYGLGAQTQWKNKKEKEVAYQDWKDRHRPFHWLAEFYDIISKGGFDVIIGNPPYVEISNKTVGYSIQGFKTIRTNNLHALCLERFKLLANKNVNRNGIILPIGAFSTRNMIPLIDFVEKNYGMKWLSFFHFRPSPLFNGDKCANIATSILITDNNNNNKRFSTGVNKFSNKTRPDLFNSIIYNCDTTNFRSQYDFCFPKFSSNTEIGIVNKILLNEPLGNIRVDYKTKSYISYRTAGGLYYKIILNFPFPYDSTSNKTSYFNDNTDNNIITAFLNSSLQWLICTISFDTLNFKDYYIFSLPFSYKKMTNDNKEALHLLCDQLMDDYKKNAKHKFRGNTPCYEITASLSKPIIDEIDKILAKHYGFTEEELDFIINYDIKYRMGSELEGADAE